MTIKVDTDHVPHPSIPKHISMVTQNWKKKMKKNTKKLKELSLLKKEKKKNQSAVELPSFYQYFKTALY